MIVLSPTARSLVDALDKYHETEDVVYWNKALEYREKFFAETCSPIWERLIAKLFIAVFSRRNGSTPALPPYRWYRSESYARRNWKQSVTSIGRHPEVLNAEDARQAIYSGVRLGYKFRDIAAYLQRNYFV